MLTSLDDIGKFDRRIRIEEPTTAADSVSNEPVDSWATLTKAWARRFYPKSREEYESKQQVPYKTASYELREYLSTVSENQRIVDIDDDITYYILGIEKIDRKQGQILTVERR